MTYPSNLIAYNVHKNKYYILYIYNNKIFFSIETLDIKRHNSTKQMNESFLIKKEVTRNRESVGKKS